MFRGGRRRIRETFRKSNRSAIAGAWPGVAWGLMSNMPKKPADLSGLPDSSNPTRPDSAEGGKSSPRIHTQIHRRNKARADASLTPLTDEWEQTQPQPPHNLKRPPRDMRKT